MRSKRFIALRTAFSPRQAAGQGLLLALIGVSVSLVVIGQARPEWLMQTRSALTDVSASVLSVAKSPVTLARGVAADVQSWIGVHEQNAVLTRQNAELMKWQALAKELEAENHSLRSLISVMPAKHNETMTVRIVGDAAGPYRQSALIEGGANLGVARDHAVISPVGLVGRVVESFERSARVLLLTDINSRVPVIGEASRERAMLSGDNTTSPVLDYVGGNTRLSVGERLVTSGDGGFFPANIPIGVIESMDGGRPRVRLFAEWSGLEWVSVIRRTE